MPHPRPWDFTRQKHVFLNCPGDSRSQNRSISELLALHADSFLMDKLNPFWDTELSYRCPKPCSKSPPGGGRSDRARRSGGGWQGWEGARAREMSFCPSVIFQERFLPARLIGTHTAVSLVGFQCVSSPKLQLERTVVHKWKQDYKSLFSFLSTQTK